MSLNVGSSSVGSKMRSLNDALHPQIDTGDKYDPTFMGVTRKRRTPAPVSGFLKEERGKQIDLEKKKHGDHLVQLDQLYVPEKFSGDTKSTRFGKGFSRRPASLIASDVRRRSEEEKKRNEDEARLDKKREYHFQRTNSKPFNPITGDIPQALSKAASHVNTNESVIHTGKAMHPDRLRENVDFSWNERMRKGAPPPDERVYTKRQERLMREGIPAGEKEWSVAQQMKCGDGYTSVLPDHKTMMASRKPYVSDRPW